MIKTSVKTRDSGDVTFIGYMETSATPNTRVDILVVEFDLLVSEDAATEVYFGSLGFGAKIELSIGGADFRCWEFLHRDSKGFHFRDRIQTQI